MDAFIEVLTTNELRKVLKSRGLSVSYKFKAELVKRLKASLTETDTVELLQTILVTDGKENQQDNEEENFEDSLDMATSFVFKDVEDALEKFTGETTRTVNEWMDHYNKVAQTCGWNDIQKYLFARKLLRGAARKAVEADEAVIDFQLLVAKLKEEFKDEKSSYEIHRELRLKKKSSMETNLEYFYDMKQIGTKVDEPSMVRYIVDGLPEEKNEKSILYDAKSLDELKTKLKNYEKSRKGKISSSTDRCKNCGSKSHQQDSCPDQQKGRRCFKCNNFGHVARVCSNGVADEKEKWVKTVQFADENFVKMAQGYYQEK